MKAPEHERVDLLGVAVQRATDELKAPVDRVEVRPDRIICTAGERTIALAYGYAQGGRIEPGTGRFEAQAGSGGWYVTVAEDKPSRRPEQIGLALAKLLKKNGW